MRQSHGYKSSVVIISGMALDLGAFGLPQVTPPSIIPFHNGLNQFNNQPAFNINQYPWQQDQQNLWQLIQQNGQNIQMPFNFQQKPNNSTFQQERNNTSFQQKQNKNDDQKSQWQLNQLNLNQEQGQNKTENQDAFSSKDMGDEWQNKNETRTSAEEEEDSYGSKDDEKDEENEELEEAQEQFEEWLENMDENKKMLAKDFKVYFIVLLPYLLYERTTANYFVATELLSMVIEKLGVNDDDNLAFMLFVQCVDLVALTRGRFKLVEGYKQNWYQELMDYMMTMMDVDDAIRLGTQMLMPQSPAPEYETR